MRILPRLTALLSCGALLGASLTIATIPLARVAGESASAAATRFNELPTDLPEAPLPQQIRILAADGSVIATLFTENRKAVPLAEVSQAMRDAVLAVEDSGFYEHEGVAWQGLARAAVRNAQAGEVEEGASTITQQYVKNALLNEADSEAEEEKAIEQTPDRKLREIRYALALERELDKDQILERYLNIAYFGNGAYGVAAASQLYFKTPPSELTPVQAALLAGLVKNPKATDPVDEPEAARERRDVVLGRMLETGKIDQQTYDEAKAKDIGVRYTPLKNGCEASEAPFFCDWIRTELTNLEALGATPEARLNRVALGGFEVKTTLEWKAQRAAQEAVDRSDRKSRAAVATVMVRPEDGAVIALAINRGFGEGEGETQNQLATTPSHQPGSTFKVFTLLAALEEGISPTLNAPERYTSKVFDNPGSGSYSNAADGEGGTMGLREATEHSVNTYFVQLLERVGTRKVAELARKMGVESIPVEGENAVGKREGSLTLGAREVSVLEMASAYGVLANGGKRCDRHGITALKTLKGQEIPLPERKCEQVISPEVAAKATDILQGVITKGTGRNAEIGRPAAGKTGTTQSFGAAWFAGYTPQIAAAVWVGDPRGPKHPLIDVLGDDRIYGGDLPAETWANAMRDALGGIKPVPFPS